MDSLYGFVLGFYVGVVIAIISSAWSVNKNRIIIIRPVKDNYRNEILYYIDTNTEKTYKMENDILYYCEV